MATLGELKDRIADEIFRADLLTDGHVATYLARAVAHYQRQRFWFNEGEETAAYTSGDPFVDLPGGWQGIDAVFDGSTPGWELRSLASEVLSSWANSGGPITGQSSHYAIEGDRLRLYPTPNASGTLTVRGWFNLLPAADGDSNGWTTEGEDCLCARTKLMICRAITLDAPRAAIARLELFGDPQDRRDTGFEGALFAKNNRLLSSGRVRSYC